ncbi:MAG: TIGR04283 family arsenosugar biosynthesis glycosyltransferase [Thermodesulfobacteriota bacterium]
MRRSISIIIPTLNEEKRLATTLAALPENVEIVVADGGSKDATQKIAEESGAILVVSAPGRARQMNMAARQARGDVLLFLHADTVLPENFQEEVESCLDRPGAVAGAFRLQLVGDKKGLGLVAWGANVRSRLLQLPYGDQALFMEHHLFAELGGFPEMALMEDFMLVSALRKKGKIVLSDKYVASSGRKWQERGLVRTTLVNQLIVLGFVLGLSADFLAQLYGVRK